MQHRLVVDPENPLRDVELFLSVVNGGDVPLGGNGGHGNAGRAPAPGPSPEPAAPVCVPEVRVSLRLPATLISAYREELLQVIRDQAHLPVIPFDRASFEQGFAAALRILAAQTGHSDGSVDVIGHLGGDPQYVRSMRVEAGRSVLLNELSRDLCQCKMCGNFFLVQRVKTGRPRRDYCTEKHCTEFHAFKSSARVRKSRLERAARSASSRRPRQPGASADA